MTYEGLVPGPAMEQFVPRVFGFRIHPISNSLPKHTSAVTDFNVGNGALVGKGVGVSEFGGSGGVVISGIPTVQEAAPGAIGNTKTKSVFLKAKTVTQPNSSATTSVQATAGGSESHNSVSEETVNGHKISHATQTSSVVADTKTGVVPEEESSGNREGSVVGKPPPAASGALLRPSKRQKEGNGTDGGIDPSLSGAHTKRSKPTS